MQQDMPHVPLAYTVLADVRQAGVCIAIIPYSHQ